MNAYREARAPRSPFPQAALLAADHGHHRSLELIAELLELRVSPEECEPESASVPWTTPLGTVTRGASLVEDFLRRVEVVLGRGGARADQPVICSSGPSAASRVSSVSSRSSSPMSLSKRTTSPETARASSSLPAHSLSATKHTCSSRVRWSACSSNSRCDSRRTANRSWKPRARHTSQPPRRNTAWSMRRARDTPRRRRHKRAQSGARTSGPRTAREQLKGTATPTEPHPSRTGLRCRCR